MFLVMEYCSGGDLAAYIKRCKRVSEPVAHHLMRQLAAGLKEMWAHNLVHVRISCAGRCAGSAAALWLPQHTGHCRLMVEPCGLLLSPCRLIPCCSFTS